MLDKIKTILIFILSLVVVIMGIYISKLEVIYINDKAPAKVAVWKDCVPDEEAAKEIARIIFKVYTGFELENDDLRVFSDEDGWQVVLNREEYFDPHIIFTDDSGVFINKRDGTITRVATSYEDVKKYLDWKLR